MLRILVLLALVVGSVLTLAAESPGRRQELLDRGAALVERAVEQVRAGGAVLAQAGRGQAAGGAPDRLRDLREQGIVTDEFLARRGGVARSTLAAPAATDRAAPEWSDAEYERTKQRLLDALRRLEGRGRAD